MPPPTRAEPVWAGFAALLLLSLAMKAGAQAERGGIDQAAMETERADIAAWLTRSGFAVQATDRAFAAIAAGRGGCRMVVMAVDPRGFHRRIVATRRAPGSEMFFVYRGVRYAGQPLLRTWTGHQLWARARDIGVRLPRNVPLAVQAEGCDVAGLDWTRVGRIA